MPVERITGARHPREGIARYRNERESGSDRVEHSGGQLTDRVTPSVGRPPAAFSKSPSWLERLYADHRRKALVPGWLGAAVGTEWFDFAP